LTDGTPCRGKLAVRHVSIPTVNAAFSSSVNALINADMSREERDASPDPGVDKVYPSR
jgi:hypothetical protein